jgi:hypothetical protein
MKDHGVSGFVFYLKLQFLLARQILDIPFIGNESLLSRILNRMAALALQRGAKDSGKPNDRKNMSGVHR